MPYDVPSPLLFLNPSASAFIKELKPCPTSQKILSDINLQRATSNLSSVTVNARLPLDKPYKTIRTKLVEHKKVLIFYVYNKNVKRKSAINFNISQLDYDQNVDWTPFLNSVSKDVNIQVKRLGDRCDITVAEGRAF